MLGSASHIVSPVGSNPTSGHAAFLEGDMTREKMLDEAVRTALPKAFFRIERKLPPISDAVMWGSMTAHEIQRIKRRFYEIVRRERSPEHSGNYQIR